MSAAVGAPRTVDLCHFAWPWGNYAGDASRRRTNTLDRDCAHLLLEPDASLVSLPLGWDETDQIWWNPFRLAVGESYMDLMSLVQAALLKQLRAQLDDDYDDAQMTLPP